MKKVKLDSKYLKKVIMKNFSMSEELAKAIGTVVVQALTENAKDETLEDDFDLDEGDGLDDSELPESAKDSGEAEEAEGPKPAPDLSEEFSDLKNSTNGANKGFSETRYEKIKNYLNGTL